MDNMGDAMAILDRNSDSGSTEGILNRWSAVCECLVLSNLKLFQTIPNVLNSDNGQKETLRDVLTRLSLFWNTQNRLDVIFAAMLQSLKTQVHLQHAQKYFNEAIRLKTSKNKCRLRFARSCPHLLQLLDADNFFHGPEISHFLVLCAEEDLAVPLETRWWFSIFISIWMVRYHYLSTLIHRNGNETTVCLDPSFQSILFHKRMYKFLITPPPHLSKPDFDSINQIIKTMEGVFFKDHNRISKPRGLATPISYGKWWTDGSLRDHTDTTVKVRLLKCPHCQFMTRVKHKYLPAMQPVCLTDANGNESPYIDIRNSICTSELSRDRPFLRFRSHLRHCMKTQNKQPDEAHFNFFGHYDPAKFGEKGYRSKPFPSNL